MIKQPRTTTCLCQALALILWLAGSSALVGAEHPLDPLEAEEIGRAAALLRAAGHADDETLFLSLKLEEPTKAAVLAWEPGQSLARSARAVLRRGGGTYEAVVDLQSDAVVSFREVPGVQPSLAVAEYLKAHQATLADPRMQEGLAERGVSDLEQLFCAPRTVGNFGRPEEMQRRLVKVDCFDMRGVTTNVFASPIEGLFATVDLDAGEVLEVTDLGVVPIPPGDGELDPASVGHQRRVRPVLQTAPAGHNYDMDGSFVRWQGWSFHLGWEARAGAVLSLLRYRQGDEERSVLYQGHLAELFVPYQDPTLAWYYRNYMDQGEYGVGASATSLVPGGDCPSDALYLSPVMANAAGGADVLERGVCLFERSLGDPLWRHWDLVTEALESRPAVELVVRFIATVGNYDYVFDWVLGQGGSFTFRGGATGIDAVKGVRAHSLDDPSAEEDTAWGPLVAPGRAGINHDHFFSVRLDLDVDGTRNSFVRERLVAERLPAHSPRRSLWRVRPEVAKTDTEARYRLSYERPALWRVINRNRRNALGYPTSYLLQAAGNALPLVDADDPPLSRAVFATHHLWVTPYEPSERYAAGEYPNQSTPGQGLPAWTANRREVEDTDIVLWYTLGFHHVPSAEDWPVYNLGWHSLTLRPYNFFDRNPALDVPPAAEPASQPSSGGAP